MQTILHLFALTGSISFLQLSVFTAPPVRAEQQAAIRVGVYDSRIVAYAHFLSPAASQARNQLMASARAAKQSGDTAHYKELAGRLTEMQRQSHLQVFSTAPATDALAALEERWPALQRELGVDAFISKWDENALRTVPVASQVDVTDRLVSEFLIPNAKQQKTIEQMKAHAPLPLWKAKLLLTFGSM